jgi:hypothetical protein
VRGVALPTSSFPSPRKTSPFFVGFTGLFLSSTAAFSCGLMMAGLEVSRLFSHPLDKLLDLFVFFETFPGVVVMLQFAFGEDRMDLRMTDHMDLKDFATAECFGDKVMLVDAAVIEHDASTKGAGTDFFDFVFHLSAFSSY